MAHLRQSLAWLNIDSVGIRITAGRVLEMANRQGWEYGALLGIALGLGACGKKQPEAEALSKAAPAAATAPASEVPAGAAKSDMADKAAAVQAALAEEEIGNEPRGQWAASAVASSTYATDKDSAATAPYTPNTVTGAPDVERYGDSGNAWATETADKGIEWLEVKFANPVQATELRVRQNYWPGAIIKLELLDEAGARHTIWQGLDEQKYDGTIAWLKRSFDKTPYRVVGARITLATNAVPDWNEIDAVQLLGD